MNTQRCADERWKSAGARGEYDGLKTGRIPMQSENQAERVEMLVRWVRFFPMTCQLRVGGLFLLATTGEKCEPFSEIAELPIAKTKGRT